MHLVSSPVIIKQPTDEAAEIYSSITLECKVEGYGYINVEWRKLSSPLPSTAAVRNINVENGICSTLKITKIVGYYGGMYYCVAINIAGQTASKHAKISVQGTSDTFTVLLLWYTVLLFYYLLFMCSSLSRNYYAL